MKPTGPPSSNAGMGLHRRLLALVYDRSIAASEQAGLAEMRRKLLSDAGGDVLEVGAGTGSNLAHYGDAVRSLTLTEPDPSMLRRLERRVAASQHAATVLRAPAEDLPFDDASFDTVVSTLVLCGVADQPRAAREIKRVLKPDGQLLLIEHVRADDETASRLQDRVNWLNQLVAGCDCNRPTPRTLLDSGFDLRDVAVGELPKAPKFVQPLIGGRAAVSNPSSERLGGPQPHQATDHGGIR